MELSEKQTEWIINNNLVNKGWHIDETSPLKNVFFQKPPYQKHLRRLKGKRPDYILYQTGTENPIAIIEAKKGGVDLQPALEQGTEYAQALNAPLVFAMNGAYCETRFVPNGKSLFLNGNEVRELLREAEALAFLEKHSNEVYTIPKEVVVSREDLIKIFKNLNDTLRSEGLRAGIERFSEFANILFLKLLSENDEKSWWNSIKAQPHEDAIGYINRYVMEKIKNTYGGEVFTPLLIKNSKTLRHIMDSLDPLILSTVDTDIKGDAFEYFLEKTTSTENDLGEYFTPRHVVKTIIHLIDPKFKETIYDPFCGTGGFLTRAFHYIRENTIIEENELSRLKNNTLFGREITTTARIAKMNMVLHGDGHSGVQQADSLANPDYLDIHGNAMRFDVIVTNMPFSQTITRKIITHGKAKIENRIAPLYYNGIAKNNGDAACVLHCLRSLKEGGRMALIVPEGFLFRKQIANVRECLLSKAKLQSVISLPPGTFLPYTSVKTDILYFTDAHKPNNQKEYWFFDAKNIGVTLDNRQRKIGGINDFNKIDASDIRKVDKNPNLKINMFEIGFNIVDMERVKKNNYNLAGNIYRENKRNGKYRYVALGDKQYFEIVSGGTPNTSKSEYWENGDINWATLVDLPDSGFVTRIADTHRKITKEGLRDSSAQLLPIGSVIVSSRATLGRVGIVANRPLATNQGFKNINIKSSAILPEYVAYAIVNQKEKMERLANRTTFLEISKSAFETIEIPLPDLEEQKRLVRELEGYRKVIDGAKQIIESWIPCLDHNDKWETIKIGSCLKLEYGKGLPEDKRVRGEYPVVGSNGIVGYHNEYIVEQPCIIIGRKGSAGEVSLIKQNSFPIDTTFFLTWDAKEWDCLYLFYYLKSLGLNQFRFGTGVPGINRHDIYNLTIQKPPLDVQKKIAQKLEKERQLIESQKEIISLFEQKIKTRLDAL